MISFLIANKRIISFVLGAVTLAIALYQLKSHIYDSGRESMRIELQAAHNEAIESQRKEYERKIDESLSAIQANHNDEIERIRNEREIITKVETVTEYVDKEIIVEVGCDKLASDIVGVLEQATSIINARAKTDKD